ncbi:MAG: enoyl-CoA hydratase-related protein, partial [Porticoccaceae bacterium]
MQSNQYKFLRLERQDRVATITLQRPEALNAINAQMAKELAQVVRQLDVDDSIGCILLKGDGKVFCAGADIKEALPQTFPQVLTNNFLAELDALANIRKPVIAAVSGAALGGGCELALMCDIIIADETARFALPEIRLGVMPGAGGSQRIVLALGKAKAMELCLTGRSLTAEEADKLGLITRIVTKESLYTEAIKLAHEVSQVSLPAAMAIKEAMVAAFDGLGQGL